MIVLLNKQPLSGNIGTNKSREYQDKKKKNSGKTRVDVADYFHTRSHWPTHRPQPKTLPSTALPSCSLVGFEAANFSSNGSLKAMMSKKSVNIQLVAEIF
jgi:hypothetical protein